MIAAGALAFSIIFSTSCGGSGVDLSPTAQDKKIVMTVGGEKVEYQEYRYFYLNNKRDIFGADATLNADDVARLKALCEDNVKNKHGLVIMAEKYGAKLSKENTESAKQYVESYRASCGDDETYLIALREQYLTDDLFREMTLESMLAYSILDKMKEKGELATDEASIDAALQSDDVVCVKEVFVQYTSDETRSIAQKRAEEALKKLSEGAVFEDIMREYSDYNEVDLPPEHGYYTMKYDALDEIWETVSKLAVGEYSVVVESPYGFHIVKRCEKNEAYMKTHRDEIFESYSYSKFYEKFYPLIDSIEVEYTSYGKGMDFVNLS